MDLQPYMYLGASAASAAVAAYGAMKKKPGLALAGAASAVTTFSMYMGQKNELATKAVGMAGFGAPKDAYAALVQRAGVLGVPEDDGALAAAAALLQSYAQGSLDAATFKARSFDNVRAARKDPPEFRYLLTQWTNEVIGDKGIRGSGDVGIRTAEGTIRASNASGVNPLIAAVRALAPIAPSSEATADANSTVKPGTGGTKMFSTTNLLIMGGIGVGAFFLLRKKSA